MKRAAVYRETIGGRLLFNGPELQQFFTVAIREKPWEIRPYPFVAAVNRPGQMKSRNCNSQLAQWPPTAVRGAALCEQKQYKNWPVGRPRCGRGWESSLLIKAD